MLSSKARAEAATSSDPLPVTTTIRDGSSIRAAVSAWCSIGTPARGCSTLGRSEFIRVPMPAARTTTETCILPLSFLSRPF